MDIVDHLKLSKINMTMYIILNDLTSTSVVIMAECAHAVLSTPASVFKLLLISCHHRYETSSPWDTAIALSPELSNSVIKHVILSSPTSA